MDHLACFVPGMLALGSAHGAVTGARAQQYMDLAENMTATCYQMYARQPTGAPHGTTSPRPLSNGPPPCDASSACDPPWTQPCIWLGMPSVMMKARWSRLLRLSGAHLVEQWPTNT